MRGFEKFAGFIWMSKRGQASISGFSSYSYNHKTTFPSSLIDMPRAMQDVSSCGGNKGRKENTTVLLSKCAKYNLNLNDSFQALLCKSDRLLSLGILHQ